MMQTAFVPLLWLEMIPVGGVCVAYQTKIDRRAA
jgi:hypothetical protein